MRQLKEALIGKHNDRNAVTYQILDKATKKDLITGDMVILRDKSIGMFISGKDLKDSDDFVSQQYVCKDGIIIFPNWYKKDEFEYCDINDYDDDLDTISDYRALGVKYIVKGVIDPNLRKNKSRFWSFMKDDSYYDALPENELEFLGLS